MIRYKYIGYSKINGHDDVYNVHNCRSQQNESYLHLMDITGNKVTFPYQKSPWKEMSVMNLLYKTWSKSVC